MAPDAVNAMDPVQRECWNIYNNPEAQARDSGISIDDVSFTLLCMAAGREFWLNSDGCNQDVSMVTPHSLSPPYTICGM